MPGLVNAGQNFDVHISFWHGFKPELFMTVGVIVLGVILYRTLPRWGTIYDKFPEKLTLNHLYDTGLVRAESGSNKATNFYMNGSIRTYMIYIFIAFIGLLSYTLVAKGAFKLDTSNLAPIGVYEVI